MFGWFDAKQAVQFGEQLAGLFAERVPLSDVAGFDERKFEKRVRGVMSEMGRRVGDFRKEHALNTYQKAKLGNAFKWRLKDAGYEAAYIDKLTDWLVLQLQ